MKKKRKSYATAKMNSYQMPLFIKHLISQNHPQPFKTSHNHLQLPKTSQNCPKPRKTSQNYPPAAKTT